MGKAGKWLRSLLTGKKKSSGNEDCSATNPKNPTTPFSVPPTTPKDKRRWSFRRSHATKELTLDEKKHAMAMAKATAAAATKIQSAFRSYLARKALFALKGLVKLQVLVRGHLVRKQATATLWCMQALITAQARARAQRIQAIENQRPSSTHRRSTQDRLRLPCTCNDKDRGLEEIIKIIEMDLGELKHRSSNSNRPQTARSKQDDHYQASPSPSTLTDLSPRGHFKDYGFNKAQTSPQCYSSIPKPDSVGRPFAFPPPGYIESLPYDYSLFPNYMTNTESSRAKARSQSVPKQRTADSFERPARRRRASMEGRNVRWSIKLDKSAVSLVDSECGSTSTYSAYK